MARDITPRTISNFSRSDAYRAEARPVFRKYNACPHVCPATPCPRGAECRQA